MVELLVVIAIIGILSAIAFGISKRMLSSAAKSESVSNLRQISSALLAYASDHNMQLPAPTESGGAPGSTWDLKIGEQMGEKEAPQKSGIKVFASRAHKTTPEASFAPWSAKRSYSLIQYYDASGNSVANGDLTDFTKPLLLSRMESPSTKALVMECFWPGNTRGVHVGSYVNFGSIFGEWGGAQSFRAFENGVNIAFADGHVQFFKLDDLKDFGKLGHWKMFSLSTPPY